MITRTEPAENAESQLLDGSSLNDQEKSILRVAVFVRAAPVNLHVELVGSDAHSRVMSVITELFVFAGTDLHDADFDELILVLLQMLRGDTAMEGDMQLQLVVERRTVEQEMPNEPDVIEARPLPYKENEDPIYTCGNCGAPGVNRRTCPGPGHYSMD